VEEGADLRSKFTHIASMLLMSEAHKSLVILVEKLGVFERVRHPGPENNGNSDAENSLHDEEPSPSRKTCAAIQLEKQIGEETPECA
jgi:hypothetical protein